MVNKEQENSSLGDRISNFFQRTWEMELLLFGFILVFLWQLPGYINLWIDRIGLTVSDPRVGREILQASLSILHKAVYFALAGMILHLFLRGFWIAVVGLRSVYPNGYDTSKKRMNARFRAFIRSRVPYLDRFEEKLEDICSANFALTFLIIFCWWSVMVFILLSFFLNVLIIPNLIEVIPGPSVLKNVIGLTILLLWTLSVLIYLIDFLSNGLFKKIKKKWFSIPYFFIYRFFGAITLSFLYRPIYYTFITNRKKKIIAPLVGIVIAGFLGLGGTDHNIGHYFPREHHSIKGEFLSQENYIKSLSPYTTVFYPVIQEKRIENGPLELFIPYNSKGYDFDEWTGKVCPDVDPLHQKKGFDYFRGISMGSYGYMLGEATETDSTDLEKRKKVLNCFESHFTLQVDSVPIDDPGMKFHIHPRNDIPGFLSYIPLSRFSRGWHELIIKREDEDGNLSEFETIPFYYTPNALQDRNRKGHQEASIKSNEKGKRERKAS